MTHFVLQLGTVEVSFMVALASQGTRSGKQKGALPD